MISTGNTKVPSYLTILDKGYNVSLKLEDSKTVWTAENGQMTFVSNDLDSLLGIITMGEVRGKDWEASKSDISTFFQTFPELKKQKSSIR